jgi:hypothetical protein
VGFSRAGESGEGGAVSRQLLDKSNLIGVTGRRLRRRLGNTRAGCGLREFG